MAFTHTYPYVLRSYVQAGKSMSDYTSLELLGEGAYGVVYGGVRSSSAAYDSTIPAGTRVAIKKFKGQSMQSLCACT